MNLPTFADIVNAKKLSVEERRADVDRLVRWNGRENTIKLLGNPYIQSYMTEHMGKTRYENKPTLKETMEDEHLRADLYKRTITKERLEVNMPQAFSRRSPICFLKPSTAKHIYKTFNATKVLDFTAGWGGRMLGAYASGIEYTGIDTNVELKPVYEQMMAELSEWTTGKARMIWEDCRNVDFSTIDYDLVFTSPPYHNKEVYEHMTPFPSKEIFYKEFLIPLLNRSLKHIRRNGWVCINVNPEYYEELLQYGFRKADRIVEFQQSSVKRKDGTTKMEQVYCWQNDHVPAPVPVPAPATEDVQSVCSSDPSVPCARCRELEQEIAKLKSAMKKLLE